MTNSVAEKFCFKCGIKKPLSDFYKHDRMFDGYLNKCKECTKSDVHKNYRDNVEDKKEYEKKRNSTQERKDAAREKQRLHRANNPEKYKARTAVGNALRDKRIFKKPCEYCGSEERVQGHHKDYSKPLEVTWVCFQCHRQKEHNQFDYLD